MDFNFILPLEQQTLVKIADTLWNSHCMEKLALSCYMRMHEYIDYDGDVEHKRVKIDPGEHVDRMMRKVLIEKISSLFLPETIKNDLLRISRSVGLQKINYYLHHEYLWDIERLPKVYHWTSRGSIDKKKTAESLIKDISNDICFRYTLACYYCCEKDIRQLTEELSPRDKERVFDYGTLLNLFWYRTIKRGRKRKHDQMTAEENDESWLWEIYDDLSTYKEAYIFSLDIQNSDAAEYFWGKLTSAEYGLEERQQDACDFLKDVLLNYYHRYDDSTPKEQYLDVALFLMRQITKGQQMEALVEEPHFTLELFLHWPLQDLFFEVAEIFCPRANAKILSDLLCRIVKWIKNKNKGFDYREVFTRFWGVLPLVQKADVINHCIEGSSCLFLDLLEVEYFKGIFLLVGDASATQKQDFIHCDDGDCVCEEFVLREEWELLKLFIDMCLPCTLLNLKFKKDIRRYLEEEEVNHVFELLGIAEDVEN